MTQKVEQTQENWKKIVRPYMEIDHRKSWWQVTNTLGLLALSWYGCYRFLETHIWLSLACMLVCAGAHVRAFIILHDCGHGTFFKTAKLRDRVGFLMGVLTLSPNKQWSREHAAHHNTSGNLAHRGRGDIWTVTTDEYDAFTPMQKLGYRLYRTPIVTFIIGPIYIFFFTHRFTNKNSTSVERKNVYWTNLGLAALWGTMMALVGVWTFLTIQVSILLISELLGVFLFYVQHQYEEAYWRQDKDWDFVEAGIDGSSYFELPQPIQWFTGNIGFHNIHHLCHRIPNYNLEKCYRENELFQKGKKITFFSAFKTIGLKLYDPETGRMVSFSEHSKRSKRLPAQERLTA